MSRTIPKLPLETEGSNSAEPCRQPDTSFQARSDVERLGKPVAIRCLNAAIESFVAARNLSRQQLAEDLCGYSESNFSKISSGSQGDFWTLVYALPGDIRADFFQRLHESERIDPLAAAVEQLLTACVRVLRLSEAALLDKLPERALTTAKASLRSPAKKEIA